MNDLQDVEINKEDRECIIHCCKPSEELFKQTLKEDLKEIYKDSITPALDAVLKGRVILEQLFKKESNE